MADKYIPEDGLKNTVSFPTDPADETAARKQIQDMFDQILAFHNVHAADNEAHGIAILISDYASFDVTNPVAPIALDQYIASLRKTSGLFVGGQDVLTNLTGLPSDISTSFMVSIKGVRSNNGLYYAAITIESLTVPGVKYFGAIYNNSAFTGWKRIITENEISYGLGSPEGVVTAIVGTLYRRLDGGANTTLYVKEAGAGNTGWVAK